MIDSASDALCFILIDGLCFMLEIYFEVMDEEERQQARGAFKLSILGRMDDRPTHIQFINCTITVL
jgi:hypothetical protein